jgi:uncharacterized protein YndB with AHSA1/START domain
MPYDLKLKTTIPASAQEIYSAWLDSVAHSEMTRAKASTSDEIGDEVSAWDGYITGRNLVLVPGKRIVQSWRTSKFSDEHEDSTITVLLEEVDGGTVLTLVHANVPDGQTSYEEGGWQKHYFAPMREYFSKPRRAAVRVKAKSHRSKTKPKRTAAKTKSKRAAPTTKKVAKAKKVTAKQKLKRPDATKAARKRNKNTIKKPARRRG